MTGHIAKVATPYVQPVECTQKVHVSALDIQAAFWTTFHNALQESVRSGNDLTENIHV